MPSDLTRDDVIRIQNQLTLLGYLDPPADGGWGPVTEWAWNAASQGGAADVMTVPPLPLRLYGGLASRIIRAALDKDYWICRHPDCCNIIYVEGVDADGTPNGRPANGFYDIRTVIQINRDGSPHLLGSWEATTQPGEYWTEHRMNPEGAIHIAVGQFKAWSHGWHHTHEAWVQTGVINGYRDADNRMIRDLAHPVSGDDFGVNQHWGYDLPRDDVENSSAGCLVGRLTSGHREFMRITMSDPRYKANPAYRVMAGILEAKDIAVSA